MSHRASLKGGRRLEVGNAATSHLSLASIPPKGKTLRHPVGSPSHSDNARSSTHMSYLACSVAPHRTVGRRTSERRHEDLRTSRNGQRQGISAPFHILGVWPRRDKLCTYLSHLRARISESNAKFKRKKLVH